MSGTVPEGTRYHFQESEILVEFSSDGSITYPGFRINYGAVGESAMFMDKTIILH